MRFPTLPSLGNLEKAVLDDLWVNLSGDAKAVHKRVGAPRSISHNTVQSTLERLHRKSLLSRRKISHAYVYAPLIKRAELMSAMIAELVGSIEEAGSSSMLEAFVDFAVCEDATNLDRLEVIISLRRASQNALE